MENATKFVQEYKVKEALYRLEFLQKNMKVVEHNIKCCQDEIEYHNSLSNLYRLRQAECRDICDLPNYFKPHLESLKNVGNGVQDASVDIDVLANLLKLLQKSDDDVFWIRSKLKLFMQCFKDY